MQHILKKYLYSHIYKIQLAQELMPQYYQQRLGFFDWILENNQSDGVFVKKIIITDEDHFHLNGYVNKQNCHIWGLQNPHVIHEILN